MVAYLLAKAQELTVYRGSFNGKHHSQHVFQYVKYQSTSKIHSWKEVALPFEPFLIGHDLWKFVDGSHPPPAATLTVTVHPTIVASESDSSSAVTASTTPNPAFAQWSRFAHGSVTNSATLGYQLLDLSKGSKPVNEYLQHAKSLTDKLAAIGRPVDPEDFITAILRGPGSDYLTLTIAIINVTPLHTFEDLLVLAVALGPIAHNATPVVSNAAGVLAVISNPSIPNLGMDLLLILSNPGLGRLLNTIGPPPVASLAVPPQAYWAPARGSQVAYYQDPNTWFPDTGATHHMTGDPKALLHPQPHRGPNSVQLGNGDSLNITSTGIQHHLSGPHTPQQNGLAERKHRHIADMTRTLLAAASAPLTLWVEAALTSVHLINLFPTSTLQWSTPYTLLLGRPPIYSHLRTFRCYRCLDRATGRVYISRHVVFNKEAFPFATPLGQHPNAYVELDIHPVVAPLPSNPLPVPATINPVGSPISAGPSTPHDTGPNGTRKPKTWNDGSIWYPLPHALSATMAEEINAFLKNNTWVLVPSSPTQNKVGSRLVANGFHQQLGIDYGETFSSVIKPATIRTGLSLAVSNHWSVRQFDVKNAFLHGHLQEEVYMSQPPGFVDPQRPNHVCRLTKVLYDLKQAPRAWFHCFSSYLFQYGFLQSEADSSLFIYHGGSSRMWLLLYVDDIVLTGNNPSLLQHFITALGHVFELKDLIPLHYFLGLQVNTIALGMHLTQAKYAYDLLTKANMLECKPCSTPVAAKLSLSVHDGVPLSSQLSIACYAKSKYRALSHAYVKTIWLTYLLHELGVTTQFSVYLHCDNLSTTYMAANPVFHARTRHIELDYHFVCEKVALGSHEVRFVPSVDQPADLLTKGLLKACHILLRSKLVHPGMPSLRRGVNTEFSPTST
ncbi:hypothetical protein D8674_017062 [Pyrus ussuriensis x Pyrus communis]|uniref:Integrase catalytic domain-containing protein n=1 Tax=Pyrus ussuriensis x Pyrus communis TaxID=2448454 RepID=A0A5N5HH29_9ROSA|nr:hypothetical protein D8674_017062 [Pyrus ussuriensis x Pyrus communis]